MGSASHNVGRKSTSDVISATRGGYHITRTISAMELLVVLAVIVLLAVLAPRFGADTHRSREWDDPIETWPAGVRSPLPRRQHHRHP
jgi:predicted anti-sigma-YlaC factor YlaD